MTDLNLIGIFSRNNDFEKRVNGIIGSDTFEINDKNGKSHYLKKGEQRQVNDVVHIFYESLGNKITVPIFPKTIIKYLNAERAYRFQKEMEVYPEENCIHVSYRFISKIDVKQ